MVSKYKRMILKVLKSDEITSTNQVREALKKLAGVKYIEFNLVYHLLTELVSENKVVMLKGSKRAFYWKKR